LNPKKAKTLIPETAKEMNLSESLVSDVVSFYYEQLRSAMTEMKSSHIYVNNLGIFKSRPKAMREALVKYKGMLSHLGTESMREYKIYKDIENKISTIESNLAIWEHEFERKADVKRRRYEDKPETDLEE
jgi:nucleoid DNA-binding protein